MNELKRKRLKEVLEAHRKALRTYPENHHQREKIRNNIIDLEKVLNENTSRNDDI